MWITFLFSLQKPFKDKLKQCELVFRVSILIRFILRNTSHSTVKKEWIYQSSNTQQRQQTSQKLQQYLCMNLEQLLSVNLLSII